MTDRSHLTPVRTTDVRGRSTTVYRNLGHRDGLDRGTVGLPTPSLGAPVPASPAQLPEITPRRPRDLAAFEKTIVASLEDTGTEASLDPRNWGRANPKARAAASLAMDLADAGALDHRTIANVLDHAEGGLVGNQACDALRVAARLWPHGAAEPPDDRWILMVCYTVSALRQSGRPGDLRITTVDELEASAAVVQFILNNAKDDTLTTARYNGASTLSPLTIRNPHLEDLLRERPLDLDRITAYVTERGMDPESSAAVEDLRAWLDSETPAVGDGLL